MSMNTSRHSERATRDSGKRAGEDPALLEAVVVGGGSHMEWKYPKRSVSFGGSEARSKGHARDGPQPIRSSLVKDCGQRSTALVGCPSSGLCLISKHSRTGKASGSRSNSRFKAMSEPVQVTQRSRQEREMGVGDDGTVHYVLIQKLKRCEISEIREEGWPLVRRLEPKVTTKLRTPPLPSLYRRG